MGIKSAASIINFVVITAALSSLNSGIYAGSRYLYDMAFRGHAPKVATKTNKNGVPMFGTFILICCHIIGILGNLLLPEKAFSLFASVVTAAYMGIWIMILVSQLKARKYKEANHMEISFKMPFWPYSNYFAIAGFLFMTVTLLFQEATRISLAVFAVWCVLLLIIFKITEKGQARTREELAKQHNK